MNRAAQTADTIIPPASEYSELLDAEYAAATGYERPTLVPLPEEQAMLEWECELGDA